MERRGPSWAEEARQEGRQEGLAAGGIAARRELLAKLAQQRFGPLDRAQRQVIDACDAARLERALDRVLGAASFRELLGD